MLLFTSVSPLSSSASLGAGPQMSMTGLFRHIIRTEGTRGLYRGLAPNFMKVVPSVSISYVVYEYLKVRLRIQSKWGGRQPGEIKGPWWEAADTCTFNSWEATKPLKVLLKDIYTILFCCCWCNWMYISTQVTEGCTGVKGADVAAGC